jgi:RNA polymerase sigma factor (sigma-70 family)
MSASPGTAGEVAPALPNDVSGPRSARQGDVEGPAGAADALGALDRLVPRFYRELRAIAHRRLRAEPAEQTLNTTALVHEAYLKLAGQTRVGWADQAQLFAVAARAMRRILVDHARRHRAMRRGGGWRLVPLDATAGGDSLGTGAADAGPRADAIAVAAAERADALVALDDALARLAAFDRRLGRVVECRFFAGLTEAETAAALGVTDRTVRRDWVKARGWLYAELRRDLGEDLGRDLGHGLGHGLG